MYHLPYIPIGYSSFTLPHLPALKELLYGLCVPDWASRLADCLQIPPFQLALPSGWTSQLPVGLLYTSVLEHMASDHNLPLLLGSEAPSAGGFSRLISKMIFPKARWETHHHPTDDLLKLPFLSRTGLKKEQFIYNKTGRHYSTSQCFNISCVLNMI